MRVDLAVRCPECSPPSRRISPSTRPLRKFPSGRLLVTGVAAASLALAAPVEAQVGRLLRAAAQAAVAGSAGSTPGLGGTYHLERFGGQALPTVSPAGAGQPCPGGGTLVSSSLTAGTLVFETSRAEMRASMQLRCRTADGTERTVDLPQNVAGNYLEKSATFVRFFPKGHPNVDFDFDPRTGTIQSKDLGALWRRAGAPAQAAAAPPSTGNSPTQASTATGGARSGTPNAEAVLIAAVREGRGTFFPDIPSAAKGVYTDARKAPIGEVSVVRSEGTGRGHVLVIQPDSTIKLGERDEEGRLVASTLPRPLAPFAAVGDTLTLFVAGKANAPIRARVLARGRVDADDSGCGMAIEQTGWVYLTDAPVRAFGEDTRPGETFVLAPSVRLAPSSAPAAPAAVRQAFRATYMADLEQAYQRGSKKLSKASEKAELRRWIFGEDGKGKLDGLTFIPFRGPSGPMYFVFVYFNDDLSDHGMGTRHSYLLDSAGKVVERRAEGFGIADVGDLNGDGIDELLTETGTIHWNGQRWVYPSSEYLYRGC